MSYFKPGDGLGNNGVMMTEAAVEEDADGCVMVVVENYCCCTSRGAGRSDLGRCTLSARE